MASTWDSLDSARDSPFFADGVSYGIRLENVRYSEVPEGTSPVLSRLMYSVVDASTSREYLVQNCDYMYA